MNAEQMQVVDGRVSQGVRKRKCQQIRNRRVKADFPDRNRDWRLRGFNRAVWRRDVLSGDQQGEVVRSIILEAE